MAVEQPRLIEEPTLSVGELCAGIGRVLGHAFPDDVWVRGEVANKHASPRGHVFFDLLDSDGDACIKVMLWRDDRRIVNATLKRAGHAVRIDDGTEVRIRAEVGWHAKRGTVRLRMRTIDTAYTLGRLAEDRERLLRALEAEGVLARQQAVVLASVPLRVGLVTSASSAAAADFLRTLEGSGYGWRVSLCDARVQGAEAETSVIAAVRAVATGVDVVCLVRGGGARTDLAAFDKEAVARAVAACPVPVLTGIGHEIDTSVADLVAHRSFKTPTACAAFLVNRVHAFLEVAARLWERIEGRAGTALDRADERLHRAAGRAEGACRRHVRTSETTLEAAAVRLGARVPRIVASATRSLDGAAARVTALDPDRLLARGWTVTRRPDGRLVRRASELVAGDDLVTRFADGHVTSRVEGDHGR
ncbi:MAG: exodeoxyribonuclease VII large subunit [Acidimicrobiales bacterium]